MYKIFVADDKFTDVIAILERRGWARSRDANSPNFLLKWRNLSNINFRLLRSDQFVNHVFNSQQLSNKALLTQNLSFLQHQQVSRSDAKQEGVSRLRKNAVESRDDLQEKRTAAPGNDDVDAFQTADGAGKVGSSGDSCETVGVQEPEVFFPRCWDVSEDGGVASLLKAFAVSAAVALLRSFVAGEGFKFDIRQWVLVTSCNPLVLWGFDEGYIRFSSKPFTMHASSLSDRFIHLCNHCVQKEGNGGPDGIESGPFPLPGNGPAGEEVENNAVRDDGDEGIERHTGVGGTASAHGEKYLTLSPSEARCNMWTVDQLRRYLCHRFEGKHVYEDVVLPRVRNVVMQTLLSVRAELEMKGRGVEWLGFDLMLTEDLRVMLIEVNVSPDVSHSTPVTARLVPPATEDALRLLLNEGEADARIAAASVGSSSAHRADTSRPRGSPPTPMPPPPRSRASNGPMCRGTGEEGPKEGRADKAGDSFLGAGAEEEAGGGGGLKTTAFRRRVGGGGPHVEGDGDAGLDRGQLKWRLWHKGNIETPAELRKLRDAKKSLSRKCSIRRDKRQSNDGSIDDGHCARNSSCEEALGAIGLFFKKTMDAAVDAGSDASRSHSVGSPKSSGMAKSSINRSVLTAGTGLDEPSLVGDREGWRCPSSEDEL